MRLSLVALTCNLIVASSFAESAATIVSKDNVVDVASGGSGWSAAAAGQALRAGDRLRTGEESRAVVRMADSSVLQLDELTTIEIKLTQAAPREESLGLPTGAVYFLNRAGSREVSFETPSANGAIRGTAFLLNVDHAGLTSVSMLQGAFELLNVGGAVTARKGEQAAATQGRAPGKTAIDELGRSAPWHLVIEHELPTVMNLHNATHTEFLGGLSAAVTNWRDFSPPIAGAATMVRREWAGDILRATFKATSAHCGLSARALRSVIAADPGEASALTRLAIELAPQCADAFQNSGQSAPAAAGFDNNNDNDNAPTLPPVYPPHVPITVGVGGQGTVVRPRPSRSPRPTPTPRAAGFPQQHPVKGRQPVPPRQPVPQRHPTPEKHPLQRRHPDRRDSHSNPNG